MPLVCRLMHDFLKTIWGKDDDLKKKKNGWGMVECP